MKKTKCKNRFKNIIFTELTNCWDIKGIMRWYNGAPLDLSTFKKIIIDDYHYIVKRDCTRKEIMEGEIGNIYAMATNKPIS